MTDSVKHHHLPQFHLSSFKIEPQRTRFPHIVVITKSVDARHYEAAIHDTGCVRDYNTIDMEGSSRDRNTVEKVLSHVESQHSGVLKKLLSGCSIAAIDRDELSLLISLMLCRSPKFKRFIQSTLQKTVETLKDIMLRNGQLPLPPPDLADALKDSGLTLDDICEISIYNWATLGHMFNCTLGISRILSQMNASVFTAPDNAHFITGDSPVAVYGGALAHRNAEISFPVSRRLMVLLTRNVVTGRPRCISHDELQEYNRRTIVMSDKYLYSTTATQELRNLVSKNASERAEW